MRLEYLEASKLALVLALIKAAVSEKGYRKTIDLMRINEFLGKIGVPNAINFGSCNINIFGTPSLEQPWGWNFWGHHVCLNTLFLGTQQVFTPVFFGAEPQRGRRGRICGDDRVPRPRSHGPWTWCSH
ncbi:DUF3500 domain-containing protein [Mycobacterium sp. 1465703.0]|uniref:DUF3500 domain-containing protein n=1 Tax=Mycobacterium sp. 1465703.0 TaxID=1834078 RepID=UPI0009F1C100